MKIIFFVFAGREANMELQWPFIERLLTRHPEAEYHVWDLTRNDEDHVYVQGLAKRHPRVKVLNDFWPGKNTVTFCKKKLPKPKFCNCVECRPAPFEEVYRWYARKSKRAQYDTSLFVKLDDDIVFIETERFDDVLATLADRPNAVVSANVVNNVVSAKHDHDLRPIMEKAFRPQTFKAWFDLHADANFARTSHVWFIGMAHELLDPLRPSETVRCLPGEKPSINFIAFHYETLLRMVEVMGDNRFARLGDEGAINHNFLPHITLGFRVAHLYFGPQRVNMDDEELNEFRTRYAQLGEAYLSQVAPLEEPA